MPRKKHSKESIITTLQNLAAALKKDTISGQEVRSVISVSVLDYHFGGLGNALEAAGLKRTSCTDHLESYTNRLSEDDLFQSMYRVEQKIGRPPKCLEYNAHGDYSYGPFKNRFGPWSEVLQHYKKWKKEQHDAAHLEIVLEPEQSPNATPSRTEVEECQPVSSYSTMIHKPAQLYGEPIDFRGLRHAPINEQGVVYLFGMVSHELGFYIEAIQQGFPDCEGKYLHDGKKNLWAKARIEFEFRASSFKEHGHDPNGCDFVVCWINDWPDCPVSVIELQKEILKLPAK